MANTIKPKRSYTSTTVPSGLAAGELAVNAADKKTWIGNSTGTGNVLIASLSLSDMAGSTTNITEGTNLYYTDARARAAVSSSATGLTYTSGTGVISFTAGYSIPTTSSQTNWDSAYTQRLQWDGGSTNLVASTGRTSLGATTVGSNFFTLTNPSAITFPRLNADNTVSTLDAATFRTAIGAGTSSTTGTITSVALSLPSFITVTNSPVTTTGTLTGTLATQTANTIFAGPTTGSAAAPTFRSLVSADIPTTLTGITITGLKETKTAPTISSGTLTLDCSVGNVFAVSLNANITTLSFTNVPATGTAFGLTLMLSADGTARTVTWGSAVKWAGGTAPTLTSTNAKVDVFVLITHDGGTTWYAFTSGQNL